LRVALNIKTDKTINKCYRHDIYAVSKQYKQSNDLISIFHNVGAIRYDQKLTTQGDSFCGY
jgi:hypothetical protein